MNVTSMRDRNHQKAQDIVILTPYHNQFSLIIELSLPTSIIFFFKQKTAYEIIKIVADLSTSRNSTSPSTLLSVEWGERGVVDAIRILFGSSAIRGNFPGGPPGQSNLPN